MSKNTDKNNFKAKYAIIGNSAAGLSCAGAIRSIDKISEIIILSNEEYSNYSKPLISYFLADKIPLAKIYFKESDFYEHNELRLINDCNIEKIDFKKKKLYSKDGLRIIYEKLCIAAGSIPFIPEIEVEKHSSGEYIDIPEEDIGKDKGFKLNKTREVKKLNNKNFRDLKGIFTFTTLDDALAIKDYISKNKIKESAILGGGLIGLKSAESLLDLNIKVNLFEMSDRLLPGSFDTYASQIYEKAFKQTGSRVFTNSTIKKIFIKNDAIDFIETGKGEVFPAKMLIIAAGVKPNTEFIDKDSPEYNVLLGQKGIETDEYLQTEITDVYAAGDIIGSANLLKNGNVDNIAIWPLAVRQGEIAGLNMAGFSSPYKGGYQMNSVEILDIPSISIGITNPEKFTEKKYEVIYDYGKDNKVYKKIIILEDEIIGVLLIGNIERAGIYNGLIKNKVNISDMKEMLIKDNFGIIQLPYGYRKHLVTGDAIAL